MAGHLSFKPMFELFFRSRSLLNTYSIMLHHFLRQQKNLTGFPVAKVVESGMCSRTNMFQAFKSVPRILEI
jgi:hypothetical protein